MSDDESICGSAALFPASNDGDVPSPVLPPAGDFDGALPRMMEAQELCILKFRLVRWQTRSCRSWRCESLCVQRDLSQLGIGLFTSQGRLDSLVLDDNLLSRSHFQAVPSSTDVLAKINESFPSGENGFFKQIVGDNSWPDRRSDNCGGLCGALVRNRRQCTTSTNCIEPPCCCVASGATRSSQCDDAFDGDDGGFLSAQPAALLLAGPALAAGGRSGRTNGGRGGD